MSKTTPGAFHDFRFWVFDVCQGLVFGEMIAVIEAQPERERSEWLRGLLPGLKLQATVNDFHITVDDWADGHEEAFVGLVAQARDRLEARGTVTPEQAASWIIDGLPVHWRGTVPISTDAAVEFADALIAIVRGTYPAAPAGHEWFFGAYTPSGELATITVHE